MDATLARATDRTLPSAGIDAADEQTNHIVHERYALTDDGVRIVGEIT